MANRVYARQWYRQTAEQRRYWRPPSAPTPNTADPHAEKRGDELE